MDQTETKIIAHLESLGLHILTEKVHAPSCEVKFLGIWCKGWTTGIPPETLTTLDQIGMPGNEKELQHSIQLLLFRRKHIPDFSIIHGIIPYMI